MRLSTLFAFRGGDPYSQCPVVPYGEYILAAMTTTQATRTATGSKFKAA